MEFSENNLEQQNQNQKNRKNLNYSESVQLKRIKDLNMEINPSPETLNIPAIMNQEKIKQIEEKDKILQYIKESEFILDASKYSNSIIIGSFCYSISFISFGIFKSRIISEEYTNVWSAMATYGGLGQITAGLLELNKRREFTSFLYLIYGIYFLTHYLLRILTDRFGEYDLCIFFLSFFILSIPPIIYSIKINLFFLIQTCFGSFYFLMRCIGEGINEDILSEQISGIIQLISGVCSFYIFMNQMFNSVINNFYLPTFPFDINNNIDVIKGNKSHKN
jgi:succinate-acetate transporter protein